MDSYMDYMDFYEFICDQASYDILTEDFTQELEDTTQEELA